MLDFRWGVELQWRTLDELPCIMLMPPQAASVLDDPTALVDACCAAVRLLDAAASFFNCARTLSLWLSTIISVTICSSRGRGGQES